MYREFIKFRKEAAEPFSTAPLNFVYCMNEKTTCKIDG